MLYSAAEITQLRSRRNHLLWAIVTLIAITTVTWLLVFGAMFSGDDIEDALLNPVMTAGLLLLYACSIRLAMGINPKTYFLLPVAILLLFPFINFILLVFLLMKSSRIIRRGPPLMTQSPTKE